jgi:hypothetical protein
MWASRGWTGAIFNGNGGVHVKIKYESKSSDNGMDKQTSVTKYDRTESMVYPVFIRLQPLRPCDHAMDMKFFQVLYGDIDPAGYKHQHRHSHVFCTLTVYTLG